MTVPVRLKPQRAIQKPRLSISISNFLSTLSSNYSLTDQFIPEYYVPMTTHTLKWIKAAALVLAAGMLVLTMGCSTTASETQLYAGATGYQATYDGTEPGRHWIRPHEFTYEPSDLVTYETLVSLTDSAVREAVMFGYPEPGKQANPFVVLAVAKAVSEHQADGFILNSYTIDRNTKIDTDRTRASDTAMVTVQGRFMKLASLGEVSIERADLERFITKTVVEENIEEGITTTTTVTTPIDQGYSTSQNFSASNIDARAAASSDSPERSRPFLRMLLYGVGAAGLITIGAAL